MSLSGVVGWIVFSLKRVTVTSSTKRGKDQCVANSNMGASSPPAGAVTAERQRAMAPDAAICLEVSATTARNKHKSGIRDSNP